MGLYFHMAEGRRNHLHVPKYKEDIFPLSKLYPRKEEIILHQLQIVLSYSLLPPPTPLPSRVEEDSAK